MLDSGEPWKEAMSPFVLVILLSLEYASSQQFSSLDIGSVRECVVAEGISYCSEYVTYEVPSSIAWLANIIEADIRSRVESPDLGEDVEMCRETLKETYCRKRFPSCSSQNNLVTFGRLENCADRLRMNCIGQAESIVKAGFCNITEAPLHNGSCRALSGHTDLQHCNQLENNLHISNWMHQYIQLTDLDLQQSAQFLGSQVQCWQLYRTFTCSFLGHCAGERVQLINTREMCQTVLECYPDDTSVLLGDLLACESWPESSELKTHPSTTPSDPPPIISQPPPDDSGFYQWQPPHDRTFLFSSSLITKSNISFTFALSLFVCFMKFLC